MPAFKRGRWLRGSYKASKHKNGKVVRVEPAGVGVFWLTNQGMGGPHDDGGVDEYCLVKDVEHLGHFSWTVSVLVCFVGGGGGAVLICLQRGLRAWRVTYAAASRGEGGD